MYKDLAHNLAPSYLSDKFLTRDAVHKYNTRGNSINLSVPKLNTNFVKSSLFYWGGGGGGRNSLPDDLKTCPSLNMFKKKLSNLRV